MRLIAYTLLAVCAPLLCEADVSGTVHDAKTHTAISNVIFTLDGKTTRSGEDGSFRISGDGKMLQVRASGYERLNVEVADQRKSVTVLLRAFAPKALYLTVYGVGSAPLRDSAEHLIDATELNALVVDLKGDAGIVPYPSKSSCAVTIGARKLTSIPGLSAFAAKMHARGIYLIGRIVVFKDNPLANCRRDLAVKTAGGSVWRDREGLSWVDPFKQEVRVYNIELAEEAAQAGFDEVQFDYVRFPDARGLRFSAEATEQSRESAISLLFKQARAKLAPYNTFIAADIFGYVCWNLNDTGIGQRIERLAADLDYISPMLYPSGFQFGIPGFRNPVSHPYEIVYRSLERARDRTCLPARTFRPWLQDFNDYAFDHRAFGAEAIRDQIRGAEEFGSDEWMLWNARNHYSAAGLRSK